MNVSSEKVEPKLYIQGLIPKPLWPDNQPPRPMGRYYLHKCGKSNDFGAGADFPANALGAIKNAGK